MILNKLKNTLMIDHLVLTVNNMEDAFLFYSKIFNEPDFQNESTVMYLIGDVKLFFVETKEPVFSGNKFNPNQIGLDHLAFGVKNITELAEIEKLLYQQAIQHSGIHVDKHSNKEKIWLNDPSGIRIEFYIRP